MLDRRGLLTIAVVSMALGFAINLSVAIAISRSVSEASEWQAGRRIGSAFFENDELAQRAGENNRGVTEVGACTSSGVTLLTWDTYSSRDLYAFGGPMNTWDRAMPEGYLQFDGDTKHLFRLVAIRLEAERERLPKFGDPETTDVGFSGFKAQFGWPFPTIGYSVDENLSDGAIRVVGALDVPQIRKDIDPLGDPSSRPLPALPVWRGMIAGSAFWALPCIAAGILFALARTTQRRRRGLCPRCKYDLAHDYRNGCPECGWRKPTPELDPC